MGIRSNYKYLKLNYKSVSSSWWWGLVNTEDWLGSKTDPLALLTMKQRGTKITQLPCNLLYLLLIETVKSKLEENFRNYLDKL